MELVDTPNAPRPTGHYAQAVAHQGLIFVSGQLPVDPSASQQRIGSIEEQTKQALANLETILEAAGSDMAHVLKTTVYISDIRLWDRVNAVYGSVFGAHKPARAVVPTRDLHYGFQIEIDAVAAVNVGE
jgi:2-iminobutanoate/2-iminopropanoate deaminase